MESVTAVNPNRIQPLMNAKGASKDRTNEFLITKNKITMIRDPSKRYQPKTNVIAFNDFTEPSNSKQAYSTSSSSITSLDKGNRYLKMNDDLGHGKNELPPLWVDIQENIDDKINEIDQKFEKLKTLRTQRFKPKFNENEDHMLDSQINDIVCQLMDTIKSSEKDLRNMMNENFENESDLQIRKNIQQSYVIKLQEVTKQLRQMEREHLLKIKNLYGEEGEIFLDQVEKKEDFFADVDQKVDQRNRNLILLDQIGDQQKQRSSDIDKIVNQLNDLAVLFKDLSTLVIEQGTILDRIDYNILHAKDNVLKANKELEKTLKRETSWRARGCMSCQVTWILVCVALLLLKHM